MTKHDQKSMNLNIVEKFFTNQTDPEETRKVLEWFETPGGKQYLQKRLAGNYHLLNNADLHSMVPELDSDKLYRSIQMDIRKKDKGNMFSLKRTNWLGHTVKAAAAVLVILTASLFTMTHQQFLAEQIVEREPIHFQTANDEHREITLSDGSVVRLNSNSEIVISEDFMQGAREIELTGEAYFDVAHNPDQPFIIHANQSTVRVLGTSFNVRSIPGQDNVQVAVVDGRVSFTNKNIEDVETEDENGIILTKGQYAFMDIQRSTLQVDDVAVENYLAWKSGKFVFEELPLQQVCLQLNRIYGVQCSFEDPEIRDLTLTADFSNESLEKTLSVIALSLKIEFENNQEHVTWFNERS